MHPGQNGTVRSEGWQWPVPPKRPIQSHSSLLFELPYAGPAVGKKQRVNQGFGKGCLAKAVRKQDRDQKNFRPHGLLRVWRWVVALSKTRGFKPIQGLSRHCVSAGKQVASPA